MKRKIFIYNFLLLVTFFAFPKDIQQEWQSEVYPLIGTDEGLFQLNEGILLPLWTGAGVQKIIFSDRYYLLTNKGIVASDDLHFFEFRNVGLPVHTIKHYDSFGKKLSFAQKELKDLKAHPQRPEILVTASLNSVFLSRDSGRHWTDLGFGSSISGLKCVAVADLPDGNGGTQLVVFLSHAIQGLSYMLPDSNNPNWIKLSAGFKIPSGTSCVDEIADILPVVKKDEDGNEFTDVYIGLSFSPGIYKLNWKSKRVQLLWTEDEKNHTVESMVSLGDRILYLKRGGFSSFSAATGADLGTPNFVHRWLAYNEEKPKYPNCAYFTENIDGKSYPITLSELWLLTPDEIRTKYREAAINRKCIYIPAGQSYGEQLERHLQTVENNGLNGIVIDMKDDLGMIRFDARTPAVVEKDAVSRYAVTLDPFVKKMKQRGIYLIARVVVFKDKKLYYYKDGMYAIKDSNTGKQWQGIKRYKKTYDETGKVIGKIPEYYDEYWVDPYCEEVWAYNAAVAQELIERGFDEIQFDYIRFPTDGWNLANASYTWHEKGMNRESALISFLYHARENIDAPIGIDIYGSNGWYRSGIRTGQDAELLSKYVDVICPMFYPSHFEQDFLAHEPAEDRTYRIYYMGGYRNCMVVHNRAVIRPWIQTFSLPVAYDRKYYGKEYVRKEILGVRDSLNVGYMYWNNSGRYDEVFPDFGNKNEVYTHNGKIDLSNTD
ncbi:MAG: hypothetical protein J1G30_07225 [Spirochaetales bacterium]|nr:hypothetical protein [Spirochaetales bacterium]